MIHNRDIYSPSINGLNGILLACKYNFNLEVIKFLINDLNFDIGMYQNNNGEMV